MSFALIAESQKQLVPLAACGQQNITTFIPHTMWKLKTYCSLQASFYCNANATEGKNKAQITDQALFGYPWAAQCKRVLAPSLGLYNGKSEKERERGIERETGTG